jgi:hypothetical protein
VSNISLNTTSLSSRDGSIKVGVSDSVLDNTKLNLISKTHLPNLDNENYIAYGGYVLGSNNTYEWIVQYERRNSTLSQSIPKTPLMSNLTTPSGSMSPLFSTNNSETSENRYITLSQSIPKAPRMSNLTTPSGSMSPLFSTYNSEISENRNITSSQSMPKAPRMSNLTTPSGSMSPLFSTNNSEISENRNNNVEIPQNRDSKIGRHSRRSRNSSIINSNRETIYSNRETINSNRETIDSRDVFYRDIANRQERIMDDLAKSPKSNKSPISNKSIKSMF